MNPLGIITARGGSKRLPGKNLKPLGGLSLIGWTARAARAAMPGMRIVLSTDDEAIAEEGARHGLDVPFLRAEELARDDTPSWQVVIDVLDRLTAQGRDHGAVVLLQPTSPFRTPALIRACLDRLVQNPVVPGVISMARLHVGLAHVYTDAEGRLEPCGGSGAAFVPTGAVYAVHAHAVRRHRTMIPPACLFVEHGGLSALDIDTAEDWALAEAAVAAGHVAPAQEG